MKFLVLATSQPSKHLVEAIKNAGHTYEHYYPYDLYLFVSESENGYDRLYNGSKDLERPERVKAKDFDAIISRLGGGLDYGTTILQHLTENLGIYCPQTPEGLLTATNKIKTTQKLSAAGLRVPKTIFAKEPTHVEFLINKIGGLPAIAKTLRGSQGIGVVLLNDPVQTNTSLESFYKHDIDLLLQSYIEAGAKDIRAIVVGDEVVVAMERSGKKDFRANISQGGSGRKVELSEQDKQSCIKAAKACGLSFAGVDIMKDAQGNSYVIEVNGNPGSKIIEITGHNYFNDLVRYAAKKGKGTGSNTTATLSDADYKAWYDAGFNDASGYKSRRYAAEGDDYKKAYNEGYIAGQDTQVKFVVL